MASRGGCWIGIVAGLIGGAPGVAHAAVQLEFYSSEAAFLERLATETLHIIGFDDVETLPDPTSFTPFASDRYLASDGIEIIGAEGQYASQGFVWSDEFVPVSAPNTYAPGPIAPIDAPAYSGGHDTAVLPGGLVGGQALSAFGCWFIDADYPNLGASGFSVYGAGNAYLGETGVVSGPNASQLFAGVVAVDADTQQLAPVITRVHIVNGGGWPTVDAGEGVVLDDFTFPTPVPEPAAAFLSAVSLGSLMVLAGRRRLAN